MVVDAATLTMFAQLLEKPLTYFIPDKYRAHIVTDEKSLSLEEQQLLLQFRRLNAEYRHITLLQMMTLRRFQQGEFDDLDNSYSTEDRDLT